MKSREISLMIGLIAIAFFAWFFSERIPTTSAQIIPHGYSSLPANSLPMATLMDQWYSTLNFGSLYGIEASRQSPLKIWAGGYIGLWRTTDGGNSWTQVRDGDAGDIYVAQDDDNIVYAYFANAWNKSIDGGQTWHNIHYSPWTWARLSPSNHDVMYVHDEWNYVTTDGGQTFTAVSPSCESKMWAVDPVNPQIAYFGGDQAGIVKTIDGGQTCFRASPLQFWNLKSEIGSGRRLYALNQDPWGFFFSDDGGSSWNRTQSIGINSNSQGVWGLAIDPNDRNHLLMAVTGRGILESLDGGDSWSPVKPTQFPVNYERPLTIGYDQPPSYYANTDNYGIWTYHSTTIPQTHSPVNRLGYTPQGSNVIIAPYARIAFTFANVSATGDTTVSSTLTAPAIAPPIDVAVTPTYYRVDTSATFDGVVNICIVYDSNRYANPDNVRLFQLDNAMWQDITISNVGWRGIICGQTSNLSTFVVGLPQNTPVGSNVAVSVGSGITLTYASVSTAGSTTVTTSNTGPSSPAGFNFGDPPTYYDIQTTAAYASPIAVCISYDPTQYTDPGVLHVLHYENNAWVDVTTSVDTTNHVVCGQVTSLSPFILARKEFTFGGFYAPVDNIPTINAAKAGQAIPIKWSLKDANGTLVTRLTAVVSYGYGSLSSCSGSTGIIDQYVNAESTTLKYDANQNQFVLVSKTDSAWAGSCKVFTVTLSDGTRHQILFNFTK